MTKFKNETRGGYPFTLYTTEGGGDRPVHGRIVADGTVKLLSWPENGRWWPFAPHPYDLIPLREPSKAAVEAAMEVIAKDGSGDNSNPMRRLVAKVIAAAYAIDFPEGGA